MVKAISILGSTGSIGKQSIEAAMHLGLPVKALTAQSKIDMLEEQARRLKPEFVAVYDEQAAKALVAQDLVNKLMQNPNVSVNNDTIQGLNKQLCALLAELSKFY